MRIAVLTSSRADYGIYLPLLKAMSADEFFDLRLLVFGTHLSKDHGYTIAEIKKDGFRIDHEVVHISENDSPRGISESMGKVMKEFAAVWEKEQDIYDLVLCLGDRYEMFAAVASAAPFRMKFGHLHGGETSLGAIDNEFRHCITLFSKIHFVSTAEYAEKVATLTADRNNIYVVGALSLDNLESMDLYSKEEFKAVFDIDISVPTLLVTFHPETNLPDNGINAAIELTRALSIVPEYQVIITMPNADTSGNELREIYKTFATAHDNVKLVENFGTRGYFSCMRYCDIILGNSSSGIIEAASFGKYVINIGDRQKGRAVSQNVLTALPQKQSILDCIYKARSSGNFTGTNIYYKTGASRAVIEVLKKWHS
jgi:GDP/UDP-N,N'-diacetylbacillosamine 2-epimerase (hydrolysing)